jgi:hypothetical protein
MSAVSIDDVIAQGKKLCDKTNDPSLDDTWWATAVNEAIEALWQLVVSVNRDYWLKYTDQVITASTSPYIDLSNITDTVSGGWRMRKLRLLEKDPTSRNPIKIPKRTLATKDLVRWPRGYMMEGKKLYIDPPQYAPGSYRVWYVPGPRIYVPGETPADQLGSRLIPYREYLEVYIAIKALAEEETDTSSLERSLGRLDAGIRATVEDQDSNEPRHIQDNVDYDDFANDPYYWIR